MRIALTCLWLCLAGPSWAQDDVDGVSLAALMIADGHYDRAELALAEVDTEDPELDWVRYHTLSGLVALHGQRWQDAVSAFEAAIGAGQEDPMVYVQLAQARLGAGDAAGALEAATRSGETGEAMAGVWLLRARAHRSLGEPDAAYAVLLEGEGRFPDTPEIRLNQILLLAELGLFQEASRIARGYLDAMDADPDAWVLVAEALRKGGDANAGVRLMEEARLRFPDSVDVRVQLAGTWVDIGNPRACGVVLQELTELDVGFAAESAECFRQSGDYGRALYMNAKVAEPGDKARQRLGLLLESEQYEQALALESRLQRLGLASEDKVLYGLAYARFNLGDWDGAERWLGRITDPGLFQHATQLRSVMEGCREEPESCR